MAFGIRERLTALSLVLFSVVAIFGGLWLESRHRATLETRIEAELIRHARLGVAAVAERGYPSNTVAYDHLADTMSESGVRITFIGASGEVLGDSMVPTAQIASLDNHGTRPEVAAVMGGEPGQFQSNRRYSKTLGQDMLFVAVPSEHAAIAVVRAAMPLDELERQVTDLRMPLLLATGLGLILVIALSSLGSHWVTRDLRALVSRARDLMPTDSAPPSGYLDEVAGLSGSFEAMAAALERALEDQNARRIQFELMLAGMEEGIVALNAASEVAIMNAAARVMLDTPIDPTGKPLLALTGLSAVAAISAKAIGGESASIEIEMQAPGDSLHSRRLRVRATPQEGGGAILVIEDVTELRRLERVRSDFVANVSHELRTPVTAMQMSAEALRDGALENPAQAARFVAAILRNGKRLGNLLQELLELSAVEAGHVEIEMVRVDARNVVNDAAETLAHRAAEKGQSIHNAIEPGTFILADEGKLEQILLNYLDNAVKYTPSGGRIEIRSGLIDGRVRIGVEDDGPGIAQKHQSRLFERFYRVDPGRSRDMGGTGLGLAIVKHLAELMGAQVGMEPAGKRGSVFWVMLDPAP